MSQPDLFGTPLPGLAFWPDSLSEAEERALLPPLAALPFAHFRFQGWTGNRRTVSFGWHYDFDEARFAETVPIPDFLLPVRDRAAALAGIAPDALPHMLVTEYQPGAGIGWHRDRPVFHRVVGISLLSPCVLRFRRRTATGFERAKLALPPRSAYLLSGPARFEWEHSIAALDVLRYSITCRSLRG